MGRVCWGSPLLPFLCPFPSSSLVGVGEDMVFTDTVAELVLFSLVHREAFSLYTALPKRLLGFLLFFWMRSTAPSTLEDSNSCDLAIEQRVAGRVSVSISSSFSRHV